MKTFLIAAVATLVFLVFFPNTPEISYEKLELGKLQRLEYCPKARYQIRFSKFADKGIGYGSLSELWFSSEGNNVKFDSFPQKLIVYDGNKVIGVILERAFLSSYGIDPKIFTVNSETLTGLYLVRSQGGGPILRMLCAK